MLDQSLNEHFSIARMNAMHIHLKSFLHEQARKVSSQYLQGYLKWIQVLRMLILSECKVLIPPEEETVDQSCRRDVPKSIPPCLKSRVSLGKRSI